jgi:hypothetical protein
MKYLHYDKLSGKILGFYTKEIHVIIPEPNIEITENEWHYCLEHQWQARIFNKQIVLVKPELNEKDALIGLRRIRDRLLEESDWIMLEDSPFSKEKKKEWKTYRQALRDLPATCVINSIEWPTPPTK